MTCLMPPGPSAPDDKLMAPSRAAQLYEYAPKHQDETQSGGLTRQIHGMTYSNALLQGLPALLQQDLESNLSPISLPVPALGHA